MLTHLAALSQEELVKDFAATWKSGIELINTELVSGFLDACNFSLIVPRQMKYFSNFHNGMEILKQVLTQLLLYYTRFQVPPAFCAWSLPTHDR